MSNKMENQMNNMTEGQKPKGVVTIAGFQIKYKTLIIIGIIIALIFVVSKVKSANEEKKLKEEIAARNAANASKAQTNNTQASTPDTQAYDPEAARRQALIDYYGEPPEGYMWDDYGNLYSLYDDTNSLIDDVIYTYIQSLSMLDFYTAEKYSKNSRVISTYNSFYSNDYGDTNYYTDFLRKSYKYAITTMSIKEIKSKAIFPDGKQYVTVVMNVLDFSNKDFWKEDREELFDQLQYLVSVEKDVTKHQQFLYDYVYSKYTEGKVPQREVEIEFIVEKEKDTGWFISNDRELDSAVTYRNGTDIVSYLYEEYTKYLEEKQKLEEMRLREEEYKRSQMQNNQ